MPRRPLISETRATPLSSTVANRWRGRWDLQQETFLPDREARFDAMLGALRAGLGERFRFLDLGAGTGSLSERILRRFPRARGVAVDFDPILLRIGRAGLGTLGGRLTWVEADLRRAGWVRALPRGRFDAVVSTTALHWFDGRNLERLYREVAKLLRPRGLFLNGDGLGYPLESTTVRRLARVASRSGRARRAGGGESWDDWWLAVERDPRFAREVELRRERFPVAHERVRTPDLAGHVARLRRAGFREVEVAWARWSNRVLLAVR
jgi:SAM-dependent methyltransferase